MTPSAQYSRMPGGGISRRPLHIIILADCSWGMKGEKIQALNYAIADMMTNMGPAFRLAAEVLGPGQIERRALRPALLLITDGLSTDKPGEFEAGLAALMAQPAGKAALRLSIAIGRDAQSEALNRFIGDPSVPVIVADSTEDIADRLVAASLAVSRMSESGADRGEVARKLFGMQSGVDVPSAIFNQDTII